MPSETFYCPHCKRQLTKSAQAYVMGESSYFIGLEGIPPDVISPGSGSRIDNLKMIKGEYDLNLVTNKMLPLYVVGTIAAPLVFRFVVQWSWVASILVGLFAGFIAAQIIVEIIKPLAGRKA